MSSRHPFVDTEDRAVRFAYCLEKIDEYRFIVVTETP
jgi:hypothetical protein